MNRKQEIIELLDLLQSYPYESISVSYDDISVSVSRGTGASAPAIQTAAPSEPEAVADDTMEIKSPLIGVFYRSPSPDNPPFVKVGDMVQAGQTVCIVEAMKVMNEVAAPSSGIIEAVIADNESEVQFGQPLFRLKPGG